MIIEVIILEYNNVLEQPGQHMFFLIFCKA